MSTMTLDEAMASFLKKHEEAMASHEEFKARHDAQMLRWEEDRKRADEERRKADEDRRKVDIRIAQIDRLTGSLQRNFGELTELILMPKIREKINTFGHEFFVLSPNKEFHDRKGNVMAEIDLLLENGDEAMIIEIKANFKAKEVMELLKCLEKLRKNESITGMKNRVMYAGIAGVTIKKDVRELALNNGMYVMTLHEEEDRVDVIPPKEKKRW